MTRRARHGDVTVTDGDSPAQGFWWLRGALSCDDLAVLTDAARELARAAPLATPTMRDGTPFRLRQTGAGLVWWSDREGARYTDRHPATGRAWPAIPESMRRIARLAVGAAVERGARIDADELAEAFDSALVIFYRAGDSLGWHADITEAAGPAWPILTISAGAPAIFEIDVGDRRHRARLLAGDAVILEGPARVAQHRIARVESPGMFDGAGGIDRGRLAVTFRRARAGWTLTRSGDE